jgi:adenine-specific DNA methylase
MNFRSCETPQKLRGGYYTQPDVAAFLTRWVLEIEPRRILEPSCGDGVFLSALAQLHARMERVQAVEIDAAEAAKARDRMHGHQTRNIKILTGDFLGWALGRLPIGPEFDAVLGNPPFIRYQYVDRSLQARAEQLFRALGLPFTRHTNAWVPFVLASLALLRPGGRLAMVVPSELLHVLHARSLRRYLIDQCSQVIVLDPANLWFEETLQGVVLLLAQKHRPGGRWHSRIAIVPVASRSVLAMDPCEHFRSADFFSASEVNGKWMAGLLSSSERALVAHLQSLPAVGAVGDLASVDVGIVTGANQFFLVPDIVVEKYRLQRFAHPMFGRSEHVKGVIYDDRHHEENRRRGLPANFLWFDSAARGSLPATARRYLQRGEAQGLPARYKCRIREPWYAVPSVYSAPVAMLKRCHHFPRLVWNKARALTTDTAYRIVPQTVRATDLVVGFVNSLTALSAELEGRHYGGGVLELVPSEIEKLLVPVGRRSRAELRRLDDAVRAGLPPESLLAQQDQILLAPLGVTQGECDQLLAAWVRLRNRRQRRTSSSPTAD